MTLLELSLLIIGLIIAFKIAIFIYKRCELLFTVIRLNSIDGVEVTDLSFIRLFAPKISKLPAFRVKVYSKYYAIRLYSGKGHSHAVHIVDAEYSSVFASSGGAIKVRRFIRSVRTVKEDARVYFPKTVIIPEISTEKDDIEVMIFSPAPRELTYVTPERNSIRVAFTGDVVYGRKIFTKSTFINFIDRDSRGFFDGMSNKHND